MKLLFKMKTSFISVCLAAAMTVVSVSAAVIDTPEINSDTSVVTVSGEISGMLPMGKITYEIVRPLKYTDNFDVSSNQELEEKILAYGQTFANKDGEYTFDIQFGEESGEFNIRIYAEGYGLLDVYPYYFTSKSTKETLIGQIEGAESAASLYTIMDLGNPDSEVLKSFGISYEKADNIENKINFAKVLYNLNLENKPNAQKMDLLNKNFDLAVIISELNESKIANVSENFVNLKIDEKLKTAYTSKLSSERKATVDSALIGRGLMLEDGAKLKTVNDAFFEALILNMVNRRESWNEIIYVADNFHTELGLNYSDYSANVADKGTFAASFGRSYLSIQAFKQAFNDAIPEDGNGGGGSGTGGGLGGSSGGGASSGPLSGSTVVGAPSGQPSVPSMDEVSDEFFSDVPETFWGYKYIKELTEKNILSGTGNNLFEPERTINREEFVKIIVLALGIKDETEISFSDLDSSAWYVPHVKKAVANGIISGYPDGRFGVGDGVLRADMAVMICRALGISEKVETAAFEDDAEIPEYARDAVYILRDNKLISGDDANNFNPMDFCTRAECAKVISELMNGVKK